MTDAIRPDEFSRYAPRWLREGTAKPDNTVSLPSRRLAAVVSDEPPWQKPNPFQGDIRPWRARLTPQVGISVRKPVFLSTRAQGGLVERLLWTAAITSVAVSAMAALGVMLFPSAPRDELPTNGDSMWAAATLQSISQTEGQPDTNVTSVLKSTRPAPAITQTSTTDARTNSLGPRPTVETSTTAPQMTNAVYVVAAADPSVSSQAQPQQQRPDPQPPVQVQQTETKQPPMRQASAPPMQQLQQHNSVQPQPPKGSHSQAPDPDEIDRLISRGEMFLAQGDVATARLLLERAAESRDPRAALALGATYDPNVLKNMGAFGIKPDPQKAQTWYERAANFGSDEADKRLTALAQLGQ